MLQTKAKVTGDEWGDNYYLVGPYTEQGVRTQVELLEPPTPELKRTLDSMNSKGCKVGHNPTQGGGDMVCPQGASHRRRKVEWKQEAWIAMASASPADLGKRVTNWYRIWRRSPAGI